MKHIYLTILSIVTHSITKYLALMFVYIAFLVFLADGVFGNPSMGRDLTLMLGTGTWVWAGCFGFIKMPTV